MILIQIYIYTLNKNNLDDLHVKTVCNDSKGAQPDWPGYELSHDIKTIWNYFISPGQKILQ